MPLNGTLRTWNDDRGFGFIAPSNGGREVFVHFTAFPRDGARPVVGERLSYELEPGKDGKPQAVRVKRLALTPPSTARKAPPAPHRKRPTALVLVALMLIAAIAGLGYLKLQRSPTAVQAAADVPVPDRAPAPAQTTVGAPSSGFRCDGRAHCSQMTSCAEAKFVLNNCPNTEMDGDHDGVPCEQQWCTSPFAK